MISASPDLIAPVGGKLIDLTLKGSHVAERRDFAASLPSIHLSDRALCDLELLATGAFSPLDRFMGRDDYERVVEEMRLANGALFPIPVTLPVGRRDDIRLDGSVALRDSRNNLLAIMRVDEIYEWDRGSFCTRVLGTTDEAHPLVRESERWGELNISGQLEVLTLPLHFDFRELRSTPARIRERLSRIGNSNVVAFQTRNPVHRAHEELMHRAIREVGGVVLLHPVVGMTKPGDIDSYTRVRCYQELQKYFEPETFLLAVLPLAMRMAGPREALWHGLIRRNFGARYFIVGRDHASPGSDSTGNPFYGPYEAQDLFRRHEQDLGMTMLPFEEMVFTPKLNRYVQMSEVTPEIEVLRLSGTAVREQYLERGRELPEWFTRPEIASILREAYPPRHHQGFCIWLTGLSGAGKSTTADVLSVLLLERGRRLTVLDGDVVRKNLSKGLGFSKEDRDTNIRRIAFVAAEIARHGGAVICAAVSPYRETRDEARRMFGDDQFIEVFVNAPLEVCEQRDPKGMYAQARQGKVQQVTGIDDPYESPLAPEIEIDSVNDSPEDNAGRIVAIVEQRGFLLR